MNGGGEDRLSPGRIAALGVVLALLFATALVIRHGDISGLAHAAPPHADRATVPRNIAVFPHHDSYDGQFFYRMGVSPFSSKLEVAGITFDSPPLRLSRVVYPAFAWALSFGQRDWVPWSMLAVNIGACALLCWSTARLLSRLGARPVAALAVLLLPAVIYGISMDLADIVSLAFVATAVMALVEQRPWLVSVSFLAALLTRESSFIALSALFFVAGLSDSLRHGFTPFKDPFAGWKRMDRTELALIPPVLGWLGWQVWTITRVGSDSLSSTADTNFSEPIVGFVRSADLFVPRDGPSTMRLIALMALLGLLATGFAASWRTWTTARTSDASGSIIVQRVAPILAFGGVLALSAMTPALLGHYRNFSRALTEPSFFAFIAIVVAIAERPSKWLRLMTIVLLLVGCGLTLWAVKVATPVTQFGLGR